MIKVVPTQSDVFRVLGGYLSSVMEIEVILGQVNRVPTPSSPDYVVMWALRMPRLATNAAEYFDRVYTGSISGDVMTITHVHPGFDLPLFPECTIHGVGVAEGTQVSSVIFAPTWGEGTYRVSPPQNLGSRTLAAGTEVEVQDAQIVVQLDVHGPSSASKAAILSTMFQGDRAFDYFRLADVGLAPLFVEDPRQAPFINGEQQYEDRWVVEINMEASYRVELPMQFAAALSAGLIIADVE